MPSENSQDVMLTPSVDLTVPSGNKIWMVCDCMGAAYTDGQNFTIVLFFLSLPTFPLFVIHLLHTASE